MRKLIFLFVTAVFFASCNRGNGEIQYIPFQTTEDGNWGMVSPEGKVLFSDEFKECPTIVTNDRFFVKSSNGNYEMYTADKKPQIVGKQEYSQVGIFLDDVVPVVRPSMPIEFIDKNGNVKVVLKTFEGKLVESCTNFHEGVSVVIADGLCGAVNTSGKTVIKPEYDWIYQPSDGKMIATKQKGNTLKYFVLSTNGEVLSSFTSSKFEDVGRQFSGGVTYVKVDKGGTPCCGLINEKGEWVLRPVTKVKDISAIENSTFIYSDGENMGVMDMDGNIVLRAKYRNIFYADDSGKLFFAMLNEEDAQWKLIDAKGNAIGSDEYEDAIPFIGDRALVKVSKNEVIFINKKGEDQKMKIDIVDFYMDNGSDFFESEYADAIVAKLKLEEFSMGGIRFDMKPEQVADIIKQIKPTLAPYSVGSFMELPTVCGKNMDMKQTVFFDDLAYEESRENANAPKSFYYFDTTIRYIQTDLDFSGKNKKHLREIFEAVKKKVKSFGSVEDETNNGVIIMLDKQDGKDYVLVYRVEIVGEHLFIYFGIIDVIGPLGYEPVRDVYYSESTPSGEDNLENMESDMGDHAEKENEVLDKWLAKHPEYKSLDPCDQLRMCHEETGFDFYIAGKACPP